MKRIAIFCDSKWRDLPGSVLIKNELEQYDFGNDPGYNVKVVSFHVWESVLNDFNPHLVLLNHAQGSRNSIIASQTRRNGGIVLVQFNEGMIEYQEKEQTFLNQRGAFDVEAFLCWNQTTADLTGGIVTGCPRFDIYNEYRHAIDSRELFLDKFNLDKSKKMALWTDSWPTAKFSYQLQDFNTKNWDDLKNIIATKSETPEELAIEQHQYQEQFKRWLLEADYIFDDTQMVVKAHPMSDRAMWDNWGRENNITIIHGEYAYNAINAADVVVTKLGSATVSEAWLLKKVAVKLGTQYLSAASKEQYDADPFNASNIHDLCSSLDYILDQDINHDSDFSRTEYLTKWGLNIPHSAKNTAKIIHEFIRNINPSVRGGYKPVDFEMNIVSHDRNYSQVKIDPFGNWDKAITQRDVKNMQWRLIYDTV